MTETVQFKLRILEELKIKLEAAADVRHISANAEAVRRLDESFFNQDRMYGGEATMSLLRTIAAVIGSVEEFKGKKWDKDKLTRQSVNMALYRLIGSPDALLKQDDKYRRQHQKTIARDLIQSALGLGEFDKKTVAKVSALIDDE
jgi:hypothetical protein